MTRITVKGTDDNPLEWVEVKAIGIITEVHK